MQNKNPKFSGVCGFKNDSGRENSQNLNGEFKGAACENSKRKFKGCEFGGKFSEFKIEFGGGRAFENYAKRENSQSENSQNLMVNLVNLKPKSTATHKIHKGGEVE